MNFLICLIVVVLGVMSKLSFTFPLKHESIEDIFSAEQDEPDVESIAKYRLEVLKNGIDPDFNKMRLHENISLSHIAEINLSDSIIASRKAVTMLKTILKAFEVAQSMVKISREIQENAVKILQRQKKSDK